MKLLSPVLSLPTPNKAANQSSEDVVDIVNRAIPDYLEQRTTQKFLLVGSGASTILKQVHMFLPYGHLAYSCAQIIKPIGCSKITSKI